MERNRPFSTHIGTTKSHKVTIIAHTENKTVHTAALTAHSRTLTAHEVAIIARKCTVTHYAEIKSKLANEISMFLVETHS